MCGCNPYAYWLSIFVNIIDLYQYCSTEVLACCFTHFSRLICCKWLLLCRFRKTSCWFALVLAPVQLIRHRAMATRREACSLRVMRVIPEPDRRCPVFAAGPRSSLPPWIFHLRILQNQCSVFAFPDRNYGSAFSFLSLHVCMFFIL